MHTLALIQQRFQCQMRNVEYSLCKCQVRGVTCCALQLPQKALDGSFEIQKSQLLAPFDSMAAPASLIAWLKQQPSSGIVQQC